MAKAKKIVHENIEQATEDIINFFKENTITDENDLQLKAFLLAVFETLDTQFLAIDKKLAQERKKRISFESRLSDANYDLSWQILSENSLRIINSKKVQICRVNPDNRSVVEMFDIDSDDNVKWVFSEKYPSDFLANEELKRRETTRILDRHTQRETIALYLPKSEY